MQLKPFFIVVFACLSAYLFSGCENTSRMGYDMLPEEDKTKSSITDTLSLRLKTVEAKAVAARNETNFLLGDFNDPVFGNTKAAFTMQFFHSNAPEFTSNDIADSIKLYLPLDSLKKFFPATPASAKFNLKIYKSKDVLQRDSSYYNNQDFADFRGDLLTETSISVSDADTLLAIDLPLTLAEEIIKAPESTFENAANFLELFKGLFIEAENTEGDGSILRLLRNLDTKITLFYKEDSKTKIYNFYSGGVSFNVFDHDYAGTDFETSIDTFGKNDFVYLQPMGGLRVKINVPHIGELRNKNILIQKAELILKTHTNDAEKYPPVVALGIYGLRTNGSYHLMPEYISTTNNVQTYNGIQLKNNQYHFDIASYLTRVLKDENETCTLMLYPIYDSHNTRQSVISSEKHSDKPKLVITYLQQ